MVKRSKIKAYKNKKGGWDIVAKAESHAEVLEFYVIGLKKLLESLKNADDRKEFVDIMIEFLTGEFEGK